MATPRATPSAASAVEHIGWHWSRRVYIVRSLPLVGHIAFGVIDRGTNILQVRPSTLCFHNCIFCSVDAGPSSRWRRGEFIVDRKLLRKWVESLARLKGRGLEVLLDGVGEPLTHPEIARIISDLREVDQVERIAIETHGGSLSKRLALLLQDAGLDRINLSIDAANPGLARQLVGARWYDVERILKTAEWIIENTTIDVVLTPVVLPGVNEAEMKALISWARRVGAGNKSGWPTGVLIQKFEVHKYGRRPEGLRRVWGWKRFYTWLRNLERETGYRLIVDPSELGFQARPSLSKPFHKGDIVKLVIVGEGWHRGETLAVDRGWSRTIALLGYKGPLEPGLEVLARIARDKDNIYVATPY